MIRNPARRFALGAALALGCSSAALAQSPVIQTGSVVSSSGARLGPQPTTHFVQSCNGGLGGIVGQGSCVEPIAGTFSATLSGYAPGAAYASIASVTTTSSSVALPAGAVAIVYNTGANAISVKLGTSSGVAAAATNDIIQPNSWMSFTVGANTYLGAVSLTGTSSLVISGGSGLPTGSGGGGGGGGGGAVTMAAGAVVSGAYVDGAIVSLGAETDASSCAYTGGGPASLIKEIAGLYCALTSGAIPAGSNTIGGVTGSLSASGGWTPKLLNALPATPVQIKGSAGQLAMIQGINPNAAQIYVQVFDSAGAPTVGTTTPVLSIPIEAGSPGGFSLSGVGVQFANGIWVAATTTATGSTAPSTAPDCNAVYH